MTFIFEIHWFRSVELSATAGKLVISLGVFTLLITSKGMADIISGVASGYIESVKAQLFMAGAAAYRDSNGEQRAVLDKAIQGIKVSFNYQEEV